MTHVTVHANARLHLGFLDLNGEMGRMFGSIGLSIDNPRTELTLSRAASSANSAQGPQAGRALRHLDAMTAALGLRPGFHLALACAIPAHVGLGSGTQLALAIGAALRRLNAMTPDTHADALLLERGTRSGIGAALFDHGGLVVDGGQGAAKSVPPVLARLEFPAEWRIVLVVDQSLQGIHGPDEPAAFAALPTFPAATSAEICRRVLMQALPALVDRDITGFGTAITHIQALLGDYFAPAQGGRFTSPRVAAALQALQKAGAAGIGQSSWGPTGFAFVADQVTAERLSALPLPGVDLMICRGCNGPAEIGKI